MDYKYAGKLPAILAFDPGGTTGWCYHDLPLIEGRRPVFQYGQFEGRDYHQELFDFLVQTAENRILAPLHIVCERFEFRKDEQNRDKIDYKPVEYIGVIRLFTKMYRHSGVKLIMQSASHTVGKSAFFGDGSEGNAKMKHLGLYIPGQRHATDAARHYAYYRTFTLDDLTFLHALKG